MPSVMDRRVEKSPLTVHIPYLYLGRDTQRESEGGREGEKEREGGRRKAAP